MSIADGNGGLSAADVAAVMGGNNSGFGWGGDGAWWLIVLFLFAMNGGWGNNWGGNAGGMMFPWMMGNGFNNADIQRGFDQSALVNGLNGITTQLSNGFANAEVSRCNGQANVLQTLNNNQSAINNAMNSLAMSLQNCCCENRAATADLKYTVATEACSDRAAVTSALNDLKTFNSQGFQAIQDKLCQLELDGVKQRNADLLAENNSLKTEKAFANQDGLIQNAINAAVARVNPTPIPAYTVQNPNCCSQFFNNGCGCSAA